jgi:hypothetical protein
MGVSALSRFGRVLAYSRSMGPARALPWALAFAVVCTATPASALPILSLGGPSSSVAPGGTFTVPVNIDLNTPDASGELFDLAAFEFGVSYLSDVLRLDGIVEGDFLSSGGPTFFQSFTDGTFPEPVAQGFLLAGSVQGGSGVLAVLQFTALTLGASPIGVFDLGLNTLLLDANFAPPLPADVENPVYWTIQNTSATVAEPTPEPVPEPGTLLLLSLAAGLAAAGRHRISRS